MLCCVCRHIFFFILLFSCIYKYTYTNTCTSIRYVLERFLLLLLFYFISFHFSFCFCLLLIARCSGSASSKPRHILYTQFMNSYTRSFAWQSTINVRRSLTATATVCVHTISRHTCVSGKRAIHVRTLTNTYREAERHRAREFFSRYVLSLTLCPVLLLAYTFDFFLLCFSLL